MKTRHLLLPKFESLKTRLCYVEQTGHFVWKHCTDRTSQWNGRCAGKIAGCTDGQGYKTIRVNGLVILVHRLVWLFQHAVEPPEIIDHIDGDRANNRWKNLRQATHAENCQNRGPNKKATDLPKNVFCHRGKKFFTQIWLDGKHYVGDYHDTVAEAEAEAATLRKKLHPVFGRA